MPLEKFFVIPKTEIEREHDLEPDEILTEVVLPPRGLKVAYYEVRQKDAFDWPLAVAAVALKMNGSTIESSRVVIGYVAPVPWRSPEAEQALTGKSMNDNTAQAAAEAAEKRQAAFATMPLQGPARACSLVTRAPEVRVGRCRMIDESDRFNTNNPNLCPALRWKGQFVLSGVGSDGAALERWFVLVHPYSDLHRSPDGDLAEPGNCCFKKTGCAHGTGDSG